MPGTPLGGREWPSPGSLTSWDPATSGSPKRRPRGKQGARTGLCLLLALLASILIFQEAEAGLATPPGSTRRPPNPLSRRGVEIWGEFPRAAVPLGSGYAGDFDVSPGWGFGVGIGFGFFENLIMEGKAAGTYHACSSGHTWDLDAGLLTVKRVFLHDRRAQPFLAVGLARLALELDQGDLATPGFRRITGSGWVVSAGMDYFVAGRWMIGIRADYFGVNYSRNIEGAEESSLHLDGDCFAMGISVGWRIPAW